MWVRRFWGGRRRRKLTNWHDFMTWRWGKFCVCWDLEWRDVFTLSNLPFAMLYGATRHTSMDFIMAEGWGRIVSTPAESLFNSSCRQFVMYNGSRIQQLECHGSSWSLLASIDSNREIGRKSRLHGFQRIRLERPDELKLVIITTTKFGVYFLY